MKELTNIGIKSFLNDVAKNSNVFLLEEGREKNELVEIAKKRGIIAKGSKDLAIIKTIYAFADTANENGAILPEEEILKVLPGIIGKPMNRNHIRDQIRGVYVDYKYIKKSKKIIAYATFFKSCFPEEWEEAKELRKQGRLATSFEIWSPEKDHKYITDSTYEMHNMEIAGGGLLFNHKDDPIPPAFPGAVVLKLAKKHLTEESLVFASKKYEGIICADVEIKTEENIEPQKVEGKLKCSNCGMILPEAIDNNYKCSSCKAILDRTGNMLYSPQEINFNLSCLNQKCGASDWIVESDKDDNGTIKCLACNKRYSVKFAKEFKKLIDFPLADAFKLLPTKTYTCPQCNTTCGINSVAELRSDKVMVKCRKCCIKFPYNISKTKIRVISNIDILPELKKQTEGGKDMEKEATDKVITKAKIGTVIEKVEIAEVIKTNNEPVVEATKEDIEKMVTTKFHEAKVSLLRARIRKLIARVIGFKSNLAVVDSYEKELASAKETFTKTISDKDIEISALKSNYEEKIELYKANGSKIAERREELGDFATELSDEDLLNEDKYDNAILTQNLALKDETPEDPTEIVKSSKKETKSYAQKAVDKVAYGIEE